MSRTRTEAYRFTVNNMNDGRINELKQLIKVTNLYRRIDELQMGSTVKVRDRVVVRARLGKNNPHANRYRRGGDLYRWSSQDIRPEHGQRFDVYLRTVRQYDWM